MSSGFRHSSRPANNPTPRDAQITRLKNEITALKQRLTQSAGTISELTSFRTQALARLAAQHDEVLRLRSQAGAAATIRRVPTGTSGTVPCN